MALLFMEGFGDDDLIGKWDTGSEIQSRGVSDPRTPGGSWWRLSTDSIYKTIPVSDKVILGCGFKRDPYAYNSFFSFFGDSGTTCHVTILRNPSTGFVEIRRGTSAGTVVATSSEAIPYSTWVYLEISVTVSDTVGEVHVRRDGNTTDLVNYTGDTKNGGTNNSIDRIQIGSSQIYTYLSDLYILNDTGSTNNDFLGDVAVRTLSPNANGNSSQLTGSDGNQVDNYLLVDERPFSSTDYTYSDTSGHKDTYAMEDLPATASTVFGVQINANMRKDDTGLGQARHVLRSGATDYVGTTQTLSTSAITYYQLYEQDPATTSAWTVSGVNDAEAGMEVV